MSEQRPYKLLGSTLQFAREKLRESLAEVSGAVEIDSDTLESIETGKYRPDEEILLLLITHLQFKDQEATRVWELAGYTDSSVHGDYDRSSDTRIMYTDMLHVVVNDNGIVLNFLQDDGRARTVPIARVGMSKKHARNVINLLSKSLEKKDHTPKPIRALPAPKLKKNHPKSQDA